MNIIYRTNTPFRWIPIPELSDGIYEVKDTECCHWTYDLIIKDGKGWWVVPPDTIEEALAASQPYFWNKEAEDQSILCRKKQCV